MAAHMSGAAYFDARSPTYDQAELHRRIARLVVDLADPQPGQRVLDIATGTGLLALDAAHRVGPGGEVVGVDISPGMLSQARRKAEQDGLENLTLLEHDAERLPFEAGSFDRVMCCSALVLMQDAAAALRSWTRLLKPGGLLAFDTPDGEFFGVAGTITQVAAEHGLLLPYAEVGATQERCRALLTQAGLTVREVYTVQLQNSTLPLDEARATWDTRLLHPAWQPLRDLSAERQATLRAAFEARLEEQATGGQVPDIIQLHVSLGERPAETDLPA